MSSTDGTNYTWGRTGIAYSSGTPAAVGNFTNTTGVAAGQTYFVMNKFAKGV
jgi:hypothetical protein